MTDGYRKNVGVVVFNDQNRVLVCARADKKEDCWQFPQGGIEDGEYIIDAALRELKEETGIISVETVYVLPDTLRYEFPKQLREKRKALGWNEIGQEQHWVLLRFLGCEDEINFATNPQEVEFRAFKWVDIDEAVENIISFKKDVYRSVAKAFAPYLKNHT